MGGSWEVWYIGKREGKNMFDTIHNHYNIDPSIERKMKRNVAIFEKFRQEQLNERIKKLPKDKVTEACIEVDKEIPMWNDNEMLTSSMCSFRHQNRIALLEFKLGLIEKEIWEQEQNA